jgi:hypothetical protein
VQLLGILTFHGDSPPLLFIGLLIHAHKKSASQHPPNTSPNIYMAQYFLGVKRYLVNIAYKKPGWVLLHCRHDKLRAPVTRVKKNFIIIPFAPPREY